jgi:glycosyltransferase involved in cell wall biosynthesis
MRVLQVANGFPPVDRGGVESYTLALSKALRALGHEVMVFCRESGDGRPVYSVRDEEVEGLTVRYVVNRFDTVTPLAPRYYDKRVEALFVRWVEEQRPDVIHFQHTTALSASLLAAAAEMGIPFTMTLWDYWYMCPQVNLLRPDYSLCPGSHHQVNCFECVFGGRFPPPGRNTPDFDATEPEPPPEPVERHPLGLSDGIYYPLQRTLPWPVRRALLNGYDFVRLKALPRVRSLYWMVTEPDLSSLRVRAEYMQNTLTLCRHIMAPLHFVKAQYVDFGIPEAQIYVMPPGMERKIWEGFQAVSRPRGNVLRLGYIGSLLRHKGVDFMVRAFRTLDAPDVELWIHGFELPNSPFTRTLHDLADGDPRIHFAGPYAMADLPAILNRLDVLLIPSLWHETFSFVTREAVLAGLPVIASRMGGIPEAIEDGVNGILLPPGDMEAWVAALGRVAIDRELITMLHHAQLAREVKSMDAHAIELAQFYAHVQKEQSG